jgi:hypothetical protein
MATEKAPAKEKIMSIKDYMNEKVPFKAILDGDKYKDDISVTVNGKTYQIQRGKLVMIPRYLYKALVDAERQKVTAASLSEELERKFQNLAK